MLAMSFSALDPKRTSIAGPGPPQVARDRGRFGFEAERQIKHQLVGAQSPRMAVTFGPEDVVFGPTGGVVLNRVLRPVIRGVSQAMIAGIPAHHYAAFAATSCHRGRSTQKPQRMIISALQSV